MDLNNLKSVVSNLTLYDVKAGVRQLQNAVMNYTEMEAKVREATNNEPWGASSTLMQEIANATFNYQLLNEIMPMIYHRFTEKTAEQWRQIYKSLQLLEFLIKNGSERVIDDARSHLSLLKMLRQFHFIDANGKDQGINVRNRSKELTDLLSDVEKIRQERKKARGNRQKYSGYEGGAGMGGPSSSRPGGGFGSDNGSYGGYDGRVYGDGGGFGGADGGGESEYQETQARRDNFEEYDEAEDGAGASGSGAAPNRRRTGGSSKAPPASRRSAKKAEPPKPKEPEVDLFDFGDEVTSSAPAPVAAPTSSLAALQSNTVDDDDFDDFQSASDPTTSNAAFSIAPPVATKISSTQFASPQPVSGSQAQNMNDLFATVSPPPGNSSASTMMSGLSTSSGRAAQPTSFQPAQPNYFTSVQAGTSASATPRPAVATTPGGLGRPIGSSIGGKPKPAGGDAFAGLLGGVASKKAATNTGKLSMADMARQKASAGIWGSSGGAATQAGGQTGAASQASAQSQQKLGGGLDDLLG